MSKRILVSVSTMGIAFLTYGLVTALAVSSPLQMPENSDLNIRLPDGEGKDNTEANCTICHDLERIVNQRKSPEAWQATVSDMLGRIAAGMDEETDLISKYLATHFGVVTSSTLSQIASLLKQSDRLAAESLIRESAEPLGEELNKILADMDRGFDELGRQKARYDVLLEKFTQFEATWMPSEEVFQLFSRVTEQPGYSQHFQAKRLRIEGAKHTTTADFLWDRQEYEEALQEYSEAIRKLRFAIPLAEAVSNQKLVAACLTNIGYAAIYSGNAAEGLTTYSQALKIAEEREDDLFRGMYLLNLGTFHLYTLQPEEALQYALSSAEMNRKTGRRTWESNALLNVGVAYLALGKREESHSYLDKALLKAQEAKDRRSEGRILFNLALVTTQSDRLEEAASFTERALEWYSQYPEVYNQAEHTMIHYHGLHLLSSLHGKLRNSEKAADYRVQAQELASKDPLKFATYLADPHLNFAKWDEFKKKFMD